MSGTQTVTQPRTDSQVGVDERTREVPAEAGDHELFSHFVPKDKLTEAMVLGTPVIALCGKVWVPHRNPDRYPVCPECREILDSLNPGNNRGDVQG